MNSTIIGQRKPKPASRHKKKKKQAGEGERERRYSEGEASDYEAKASANTEIACNCKQKLLHDGGNGGPRSKAHAKDGRNVVDKQTKGPDTDKTAHLEFKNGLMFDIEI